jgi:iron complex outermembrane receptor protein
MSNAWSRLRGIAVLSVAFTGLASTPSFAAEGEAIEEIIVTAEKRETSAQETPIALTAYDAEQLHCAASTTLPTCNGRCRVW